MRAKCVAGACDAVAPVAPGQKPEAGIDAGMVDALATIEIALDLVMGGAGEGFCPEPQPEGGGNLAQGQTWLWQRTRQDLRQPSGTLRRVR